MYLLLSVEETGQVVCIQVIFEVAVGEHEEVQIPASRHHLVEGAELLEAKGSLVVIGICLLHIRSKKCLQSVFNGIPIIFTPVCPFEATARMAGDLDQAHIYC